MAGVAVRIGYKASAEQFDPVTLLEYSVEAERAGLEIVAVSDHFQPWRHHGGHSPAALPWLAAAGQRTQSALLGTSVLTPTLRYHPSVIAQAFATLGCLSPGRIFLGVGTGEAMNETPVTGGDFPGRKERRLRLAEAIELIRRLWSEERVDFEGRLVSHREGHDLRPAGRARADLRGRLRPARGEAGRARWATASSARAARTRRSTTSCSARWPRAPSRPAATRRRSGA